MALLQLRIVPDPILWRKAKRVTRIDTSIQTFIDDMFETMYASRGVGLAGNQVGMPLRVLVLGIPSEEGPTQEYALINPQFLRKVGERLVNEGCLSIPGHRGQLNRAQWVRVKGLDRQGQEIQLRAEGLLAQVLEHEIDHLNGVLWTDRWSPPG